MHYAVSIQDGGEAVDHMTPTVLLERFAYIAKRPLFKHGRPYEIGEEILLDETTAARFRANGDIE